MSDYCQHLKFRGQEVLKQGNRYLITIREAKPQRGGPPTIGLSDKLLEHATLHFGTIYVNLLNPKRQLIIDPREWLKIAKKEEQESYYNIPWYLYVAPIPKLLNTLETTVQSPMTEDEMIKRNFYKYFIYR